MAARPLAAGPGGAKAWRRAGQAGAAAALRTQADDLPRSAIALAFPDRLSRRRDSSGEHWQSVGGRGFRLDPASPLARQRMARGRPRSPALRRARGSCPRRAIDELTEIEASSPTGSRPTPRSDFDPATGSDQRHQAAGGSARSSFVQRPIQSRPGRHRSRRCSMQFAIMGSPSCRGTTRATGTCASAPPSPRSMTLRFPTLEDAALVERLDEWLSPLLSGKRRLTRSAPARSAVALDGLLDYEAGRAIDRLAPTPFRLARPDSSHPIDYAAPGGPTVEVRAQALFGLEAPSDGRGRARAADPGHHLACAPADPDDQGPACLLGGKLARGRQGNARPLSEASLAGRSRGRPADAADQAQRSSS